MALRALNEIRRIPRFFQESPEQREQKVVNHLQEHLNSASETKRTFFQQISYYPSKEQVTLHQDAIKYALAHGWVIRITYPRKETFGIGEVLDVKFTEEGIVLIMDKNPSKIADATWCASYNPKPHEVDLVRA